MRLKGFANCVAAALQIGTVVCVLSGHGIEDVITSDTCASDQFRCENGRCIPQKWKCDSSPDCEDGSDEPPDCSSKSCKAGQFQCALTHKCIPHGWICDEEPDCGVTSKMEEDASDEDPRICKHGVICPPNFYRCESSVNCLPVITLCNGALDCPDESDEGEFCHNDSLCKSQCEFGCRPSRYGPLCYCENGKQPNGTRCVDSDECLIDGSCDQLCTNTQGSYDCKCVAGYMKNGTRCHAINVPEDEPPSIIYSSTDDVQRIHLNGSSFEGNSLLSPLHALALEFNHQNHSLCYVHHNSSNAKLSCADIDNMNESWDLPMPTMFPLDSMTHIALDWISGNWYFLDDTREMIFLCNSTMQACMILIEVHLSKPRGIALDPTKGLMFFTKWGASSPMLERALLDGSNRTTLVHHKIVYPYGVTVDFPTQHVYWVDTYLDFVERVDYDGSNRRTIKKGFPVQNLYDITVFENNLYVTSWRNESIIRLDKFHPDDHETVVNLSRPFAIHVFHRQRQPEVSHPCSTNNGGCEHICIPAWKKAHPIVQCLCKAGFRPIRGGQCVVAKQTQFILYGKSRPPMIKAISLNSKLRPQEVMIPITDLTRPAALDYEVKTQYIYYSDVQRYVIERQKIDGTDRSVVLDSGINNCEGLAIDWMGRNIYWTDQGLGAIGVAKLEDTKQWKHFLYPNMFHPRAIVVHPKMGLMYWTDWASSRVHTGKIEQAWMDGTNRRTFIDSDLQWPNGLSIDYTDKRLYWCDAFLDKIESALLDGSDRKVVYIGAQLDHPYGLAYYHGSIYWTEFQKGTVHRRNLKDNSTETETLSEEFSSLFEIRIFDSSSQTGSNACSNNNNGCPELCLAIPNGTVCVCRDGHMADGDTCVAQANYTAPSRCTPRNFQCQKNLRCIDNRYVCDGDDDCGDGSDENTGPGGVCENVNCREGQFRCDSNRCITHFWVCDGDKDCADGSDEDPQHCDNTTCSSSQFTCKVSGRCIPLTWTCDSDPDCGEGDTSDEPSNCEYPECLATEFMCDNKRCVPLDYFCDGDDDCHDGSDEKDCHGFCDPATQIFCPVESTCLPLSDKCNGVEDCSDGSDEAKCNKTRPVKYCENSEFRCADGSACIKKGQVCNKQKDCADGSDEKHCETTCEKEEWRCSDGACIRLVFKCDGHIDCLDASDEDGCHVKPPIPEITTAAPAECPSPSQLCDNATLCLPVEWLCDGKQDCQDGSDEGLRCDERMCDRSECSHFCHNTPTGMICSCPKHLHLQPDGITCLASHPCEVWGVCSQKCIPLKRGHKCECENGYLLEYDGFTCKSTDNATAYVIFSNRHELRGVDLHTFNVKALISSLKNTIALDFYFKEDNKTISIYWTDVIDDKIYRGTLVGGSLSNIEVVVQTGLATAEGLAVDWIGQNLYWVESNLDQIEVAKLNGSFRRTLIAGDMEAPRAIALDPRFGLLFWTDWDANAPRIERCSMSGQYRTTVVHVNQVTDGEWPNGLTLDYVLRRIYWIDARSDSIHTTTYDGLDHREVMRGHEMLSHPFAIALFENYVYWTDWRTNAVIRANKWNGSDISVIQRTLTQPFDIQILHPSRQPRDVKNPCANNNGNCSHLCLLSINGTYKCDCPHVQRLDSDQRTCVVNEQVLLFSRANEIRGVDLGMPYYHTIPTISLPQVLSPSQLDFIAKRKKIYWTDIQVNEVKRTGLTGVVTESIIDTGIENPTGFAIDWISENMYISSYGSTYNHIVVCSIEGEMMATVVEGKTAVQIRSLTLDPTRGKLYWSYLNGDSYAIQQANMDGNNQISLVSHRENKDLESPQSLTMDLDSWRLYWVNTESNSIQYYDFTTNKVENVPLKNGHPTAATVYGGFLYYANQDDTAIHVANKTTGANDRILRNNTGNVMSLRIYDPLVQTGTNPCEQNKGNCSHLCLPVSETERVCKCATGYVMDMNDNTKCIGIEEFLFYSINWEIKGLPLGEDNMTQVLGPISRVSMASSIDFLADEDYLYWADSDHGIVTRIHRDGTGRQTVVEHFESMESIPVDWLPGIAVDWVAGNIYWTDPKFNVIEMARLNGSCRYVVVTGNVDKPTAIAVDPPHGFLFWSDSGKDPRLERARLDGSDRLVLVNDTGNSINDIALDYENQKLYWCDSRTNRIERIDYDGSNREVLLEQSLDNPRAITIYQDTVYWIDITYERGSILSAPASNLSDQTVLLRGAGDALKDIQVYTKARQMGTNACAVNNGGCRELCLFNGTHPVCACAHGKVSSSGSCEDFDSFLVYSRVVRIDTINMFDELNRNAPYRSIHSKDYMRNAIGLSFDYARRRIFYSDIQRGSINSVFFNGTGHRVIVERQGSVEGLAYEAVNNMLYWTCNNDATINRINLMEGNKSKVEHIITLGANDKPRGIDVDSCNMQIYWTNWNSHSPAIQRAQVNGHSVESIITTDIRMPNALTLDHKAQKLYWGDARLDKIERAEYDGSNRVVLAKVTPQHPFDLAVYGDYIFWTDWVLHAVIRANKYTGDDVVWLRKEVPRPMGIIAVANDTNDCMSNPCRILNGGCEDICNLDASGNVLCGCYSDRILMNDSKRCASKNVSSDCKKDEFFCSSGGCIPFSNTCDTVPHCEDASDEDPYYCAIRVCQPGYFHCYNNRCIPGNRTCNQMNDCGDASDELNCTCSSEDHFRCAAGPCISKSFRCDGDPDCPDASDEMNCETRRNCSEIQPNLPVISCNYTTACIHVKWICDGENDCWDNSDEENCEHTTTPVPHQCAPHQFRCSNGLCIMKTWQCDKDNDCEDSVGDEPSSDERNCTYQCRPDQFQCNNSECIPTTWQCDGTPDCSDSSDELESCQTRTCPETDFRCNNTGRCIPMSWACDGEQDCSDNSDESADEGCLTYKPNPCAPNQFQCANLRCIDEEYYCDRDNDCGDGSDEPFSCDKKCQSNEIACRNGKCILASWTCNGKDDCGDNSDEDAPLCNNKPDMCLKPGMFRCKNELCVNDTLLCDGTNDCGDYSDEWQCDVNECHKVDLCAHICVDKRVGYECRCRRGFHVNPKDKHLCSDIDECLDRPCSQICRNTLGSYVCSCADGYVLRADKHSCKAVSSVEPKLIFTNRYYIRELDLNGQHTLRAHNLTNAVALDYDWAEQCIYWSDVTALGSSIKRLCGSDTNDTYQVLHSATLQNPDGLAVDWVGRNLYWCDKGLDTIEVSKLDGRFRKVLINSGLQEPRAIVLDPRNGYMYWTDWGERPYIGKAGMDGSVQRILVNDSLGWPNALTISYETNEIFWADAREDYIAVSDLEGGRRKIVLSREKDSKAMLHHIFAMTVLEDYLYWTDWETKTVERCHKYNGTDRRTLTHTVHRPMDIHVYHPLCQVPVQNNPCLHNAGCSTLCLLTPQHGYQCACPENYILGEDGKSCISNCTTVHFVCATTYKCIPFWWKCDTQDDCGDGSDEPKGCPKFECMPGQFQCNNSNCIHPSQLCNGVSECGDGSDEVDCNKRTCLNTQFKCKGNGTVSDRCIPISKQCDDHLDCPNGEDELNCPPKTCPPNQFSCKNKKCIPSVWECDGDNDCMDNSDETQNCKDRKCPPDHFKCQSGRCIPKSWQCDGDRDCPSGEDEPESCSSSEHHKCDPSYFKCNNNKCIPGRWRCDYDNDCGDHSDEEGCMPRECSESEFRCSDGRCIRGIHRCDGEFNCDDHSDEQNCNTTCATNEFQCLDPHYCIYIDWRCDGDTDCSDGSDEANCNESCPDNQFTCQNKQCISPSWRCDGDDDCGDGSDEMQCEALACHPGRHRCKNHICILPMNVCDGVNDCGDGSDEDPEVCQHAGRCGPQQFRCGNQLCISKKFHCDGFNDCGDNTDEDGCTQPPCHFGACSQICVEKKSGTYACHCAPGFNAQGVSKNKTCVAQGSPAHLMVASDTELRDLNPYKAGDSSINQLFNKQLSAPSSKVESMDILWDPEKAIVFWSDHHSKKIHKSFLFDLNSSHSHTRPRRVQRDDMAQTLIENLIDPRGLAVDWVGKRLYWVDAGLDVVMVSSLNGDVKHTLVHDDLDQPQDIVVDPLSGRMFWSDWGVNGRIESAYMDGSGRHVLVDTMVQWPTGLAVDYPARRLYWTDPKAHTVESVDLNGQDRQIIKKFSQKEKPYKVEVFEDNLYISTYQTNNIIKMNKFGYGNITYLVQGLNRASDILIVQENKQTRNLTNPCEKSPCHKTAMCLLTSGGSLMEPAFSCVCPDGQVKTISSDNNSNSALVVCKPATKACDLDCHKGSCYMKNNDTPACKCQPLYEGDRCQHFRCSQFCRNKGLCFADLLADVPEGSPPPLKCNCPPQWTGERCETQVHLCENRCLNNGTCYSPRPGLAQCRCLPGFTGSRCEQCTKLLCHNGGICGIVNGAEQCTCPKGYNGSKCERSECEGYCQHGSCTLTHQGPQCQCNPGYTGKKCEHDSCENHCQNGGTCKATNKTLKCECPPLFSGRRCELNLCSCTPCNSTDSDCRCPEIRPAECASSCYTDKCNNGGTCVMLGGKSHCACPPEYGDHDCSTYYGSQSPCQDYCANGGLCLYETASISSAEPRCRCTNEWIGRRCKERVECKNYCFNGGTCQISMDSNLKAVCICLPEYVGIRCQTYAPDLSEAREVQSSDDSSSPIIIVVIIAAVLFMLLVGVLLAAYLIIRKRRSGKPFMHVRMQENVEISNPMYLREEVDEEGDALEVSFSLDADKSGNFANPVYDSLYSVANTGANSAANNSEEKKGLLQHAHKDTEHPLVASRDNI